MKNRIKKMAIAYGVMLAFAGQGEVVATTTIPLEVLRVQEFLADFENHPEELQHIENLDAVLDCIEDNYGDMRACNALLLENIPVDNNGEVVVANTSVEVEQVGVNRVTKISAFMLISVLFVIFLPKRKK